MERVSLSEPDSRSTSPADRSDMVEIEGGALMMGSVSFYPEEAPLQRVSVQRFLIDPYPVTNRRYADFVDHTGYVTVAERPLDPDDYPGIPAEALQPGSLVFAPEPRTRRPRTVDDWWEYRAGATWRAPTGPGSSILGIEDHPVVHVAYEDARAYADWAGKDLPSEAQWEFAARGGIDGRDYAWGEEFMPGGIAMANTWQGRFPFRGEQGDYGTSRIGSYPANGFGLFDMIGNVWEWTSDWYGPRGAGAQGTKPCCASSRPKVALEQDSYDPSQPAVTIPRKVLKGGSFLCSPDYCRRYRPAARQPQMIDTASCHIGFRCVINVD
jgi:formylglycine-generating enzyme